MTIKDNTFYKIIFDNDMTPEQKRKGVTAALVADGDDQKLLREFQDFTAFLQSEGERMRGDLDSVVKDALLHRIDCFPVMDKALTAFNKVAGEIGIENDRARLDYIARGTCGILRAKGGEVLSGFKSQEETIDAMLHTYEHSLPAICNLVSEANCEARNQNRQAHDKALADGERLINKVFKSKNTKVKKAIDERFSVLDTCVADIGRLRFMVADQTWRVREAKSVNIKQIKEVSEFISSELETVARAENAVMLAAIKATNPAPPAPPMPLDLPKEMRDAISKLKKNVHRRPAAAPRA